MHLSFENKAFTYLLTLKSNVDFHCMRCLEGNHVQTVSLKEVVIEPNVKLECDPKFCYLGDTLGAGGGLKEVARARVKCSWGSSRSSILAACGALYHI